MTLVGKQAPKILAGAVINGEEIIENFSLDRYIGKKNVVLFFYPKDFTFVCPTEIHAFQEKADEFERRNTVVIGCSTDTEETHLAWLNTAKDNGGIQGVTSLTKQVLSVTNLSTIFRWEEILTNTFG